MSAKIGIHIPLEMLDDTCSRACLINEHRFTYDLDSLAKSCLGLEKVDIIGPLADLFGGRRTKNVQMAKLHLAPPSLVSPYATRDSRITLRLWEWQRDEILHQDQRGSIPLSNIVRFERALMPLIIRREAAGIRVDVDAALRAQRALSLQIQPLQAKLDQIAGFAVNVLSNNGKDSHIPRIFEPRKVGRHWVANNGERVGTTDSGGPSFAREVLQDMSHPAAKLVVELRGLFRLRDTFLGKHVLGHQINGRVFPRINQNKGEDGGTGTGRLSYVDPALQQIPARDKVKSAVIRPVFLPEEGHTWVDTDKASFEVRVFGHLISGSNPGMLRKYKEDPYLDFHQYVADLCHIPRERPPEGGANGKQLNLSMIFTQGEGATAEKMGLPWTWDRFLPHGKEDRPENYITYRKPGPEAKAVIEEYHKNVPGVREFSASAKERALERGFVFTKYGRRLRFPGGFKAYKASGLLIQATAADWNKENWKLIDEALDGEGQMLINIHDGYGLSLPEGREEEIARRVKEHVEQQPRSRVPLILEINKPGKNWWDSYSGGKWFR
jgi:DNA polymerase I-like protein with 3'-5' exonuclease and polymerase domains